MVDSACFNLEIVKNNEVKFQDVVDNATSMLRFEAEKMNEINEAEIKIDIASIELMMKGKFVEVGSKVAIASLMIKPEIGKVLCSEFKYIIHKNIAQCAHTGLNSDQAIPDNISFSWMVTQERPAL